MEILLKQYHQASGLQKRGRFDQAREQFKNILESGSDLSFTFKAGIYFHLAQMEPGLKIKKELLNSCLELEPNHRMARVLLSCLIPKVIDRLKNDHQGLIRQYFERYPLNLQFQTISTCNGKCTMCPYHQSWHKNNPGSMTMETFSHAVDILQDIPLAKVCLYLENEPLLDSHIFEKIEQVKKKLKFGLIEISSNVSPFTDENIKKLHRALKDVPHQVWLSWHGITENKYRELMGFDFKANLQKLKSYITLTNGELNTFINSIIGSKLSRDEQYSTADEARDFFSSLLQERGYSWEHKNYHFKPFYFNDRAGNIGNLSKDNQANKLLGKLKPECWRIKEWLHILYDGDIILCCMDYFKETVMGNIKKFKSLEELLLSAEFAGLQAQAVGKKNSDKEFICRRCLSPGG